MADGLNEARAMRIAEILSDFRNLQHYIASIRPNPSPEEYYEDGYVILRQCAQEAQALLNQRFDCQPSDPNGDEEVEKAQLQQILLDASVRRFRIQQIYLKAGTALRWIGSRNAILRGSRPQSIHRPALQQISNTLRAELSSITPARTELSLRSQDTAHGKWLAEDPTLNAIEQAILLQYTDHHMMLRQHVDGV